MSEADLGPTPEIRHGAQGVVEAIREIRRADYERQLDDLSVVKKLPQFC